MVREGRKSLIGASFLIVQPLLLNALALPVTAFIIATLGPLDYGQWSVALTLITSTAILSNLGLRSFFIRSVAQQPSTAATAFAEQLGLRLLLALLAGCVSASISYLLGYPVLVQQCTAILAIGAVFAAAAAVVSDFLAATERLPALATINLAAGVILTVASVVALWLDAGLLGLALAYLLGPLVTGVLSIGLVHRRHFPVRVSGSPARYLTLLKQSKVLGLQLFVMNLSNHVENLLVPKLVGLAAYGHFSAGTLLPRRLEVVPDGLNTAFYPVLARSSQKSAREALGSVTRLGVFMLAACVPPALAVFLLAGPIATLLFPEHSDVCRMVIRITVWWMPLIGFAYAIGYFHIATGREREEFRISIVVAVVSLASSVALISAFGLVGACWALVARAAMSILFRVPCFVRTVREMRDTAGSLNPRTGSIPEPFTA